MLLPHNECFNLLIYPSARSPFIPGLTGDVLLESNTSSSNGRIALRVPPERLGTLSRQEGGTIGPTALQGFRNQPEKLGIERGRIRTAELRLGNPLSTIPRMRTQPTFLVLKRLDVERSYRGDTPNSPATKKWSDPKVSSVTQTEPTPILEAEMKSRSKFLPDRPGADKKVGKESFKGVSP